MNLRAISDLHLNAQSKERNAQFLAFLESALRGGDHVLIVGDLFEIWLGWPQLTFPYQKEILGRMGQLRREGLVLYYVEGNRDFRISAYSGSLFSVVTSGRMQLDWGGRVVCAEHGDLVNRADWPYRTWRAISKNRLAYTLLSHLPPAFLLKRAEGVEERMRDTNRKHKLDYPAAYCRKYALQRARERADIVVIGHFHIERHEVMADGKRSVLFYNLPGWEEGFRYLIIPQEGQPYFSDLGR